MYLYTASIQGKGVAIKAVTSYGQDEVIPKRRFPSLENLAEGSSIKPMPPYLEEVGPTSWGR